MIIEKINEAKGWFFEEKKTGKNDKPLADKDRPLADRQREGEIQFANRNETGAIIQTLQISKE